MQFYEQQLRAEVPPLMKKMLLQPVNNSVCSRRTCSLKEDKVLSRFLESISGSPAMFNSQMVQPGREANEVRAWQTGAKVAGSTCARLFESFGGSAGSGAKIIGD